MKKSIVILLLVTFGFFNLSVTNAASWVVDQGDQASVTNEGGGADDLGSNTDKNINKNWQGQVKDETPIELQKVTFEKTGKDNFYSFDFNIAKADKVFATEFEEVKNNITLSELSVNWKNWEEISDDLKNSISLIVIKDKENPENNLILGLDEISDGVSLEVGDKIYLLYDPEGTDNKAELQALNNTLVFKGGELPLPLQFGVAETDDNLNVLMGEPSESYEEIIVEAPQEKPKEQENVENTGSEESTNEVVIKENQNSSKEDKNKLVKKDTGPVENFTYLFLLLMLLISGSYFYIKKES